MVCKTKKKKVVKNKLSKSNLTTKWKDNWCSCKYMPKDNEVFSPKCITYAKNYERCVCNCGAEKEHYHCRRCKGIIQMG